MAKQAPDPIDVQDFQFILHCRLKIFTNEDSTKFNKPCSLITTASRFGLIFIGTTSPTFQVIQLKTIEKHTVKEGEIANYNRRHISLPSPPKHLAVNCDCTRLAVVVERNDCAIGLIYDVTSMMKQVLPPPIEIRLSPTPGVNVVETSWNPTIPNIFTACKSDGTLGLYELKETGVDINELPSESQATCMCWSPKGKQIAVGSHNGRITQYKPDLKAMKVVNAPPLVASPAVLALQWISNYQFIALYKPQNSDSGASLLVVDSPKTGDTTFSNYDDICYSYGNTRPPQFYTIFQATWNILMVASSNSMEVGVLGSLAEQWTLWILADSARAELPLSASKQETLPIGLAFDASATEPVIWGESSLPPAPYLLLLSHHGLLCCFRVVNIRSGGASICQPPEAFADMSGLNQFISIGSAETAKPEIQKVAPVLPPKSTEATLQQQSLPFSQPSAAKLPQVPLFTNSSSLFTSGPQFNIPSPKPESAFVPKPDSGSLSVPKPVSQNLFGSTIQQPTPLSVPTPTKSILIVPSVAATTVTPTVNTTMPVASLAAPVSTTTTEGNLGQEDADLLISKLVREECDMLETELKALLHKGRSLKIDLGTDTEAVELVHGADELEEFLKEVNEASGSQAAEVHSLKQGLIQTWAWYEDARSRFAQTQDLALDALLRIQQLDPVSQRYLGDIQHMTYYLTSQLTQAGRVLDEQWENFQDSCRKIVKLKIPTMETIYQTMVRQSAVHQRQQYILKDISSRIRAQRSKMTNPTLLISLNNADQLEKELRRLQLEPQHFLQAQYERVVQNQQKLTSSKVQKLSKLLLDREIVRVTYNRPKLSNVSLKATIHLSPQSKTVVETSLLGAGLSPITTGKHVEPQTVDFIQSTPKSIPSVALIDQKPVVPSSADVFKAPNIPLKFTSSAQTLTSAPTLLGQAPPSTTAVNTGIKIDPSAQFKFTTIPTSTAPASTMNTTQLNFGFDLVSSTSKITSPPVAFTASPVSQTKSVTEVSQSKPSVSFGSLFGLTKPTSSTFSFSLTTTTAASVGTATKPIASSTASSAFVPTTQLPFSFNAKVPISTTTPSLVSTTVTVSKASTFIFGTATSTKSDNSLPITTQASISTAVTTVVSTMPVTVVASSASATTSSLFGLLKTPAVDITPVATPSVPAVTLFKIPSPESTAPSVFQGLSMPKTTTVTQQTESAAIPSSDTVIPATITPIVISSNQGSLFGTATATSQAASFSFANSTKIGQPITVTTATVTTSNTNAVTITPVAKPEKEPSVFGKVQGSIFGAPAATTTNSSLTGTATTTVSSYFGAAATGSIFNVPTSSVASEATPAAVPIATTAANLNIVDSSTTAVVTTTSAATSIFGSPLTSTTGSIFGAPPTTTTGSIFGSAVTSTPTISTTSMFGAVGSQPELFSSIAASNSTPTFTAVPTATVFATSIATPLTIPSPAVSTPTFAPAPTTTTTSIFGSVPTTTTTPSVSVFNVPTTTAPSIFAAANATLFGAAAPSVFAQQPASPGSSVFGAAPASPVFGGLPKTVASGPFGAPPAFGSGTTSAFGATTTASGSVFGATTTTSGSVFGQPAAFGNGSVFGAPVSSSTNAFGSNFGSGGSIFGAPSTTSSTFGQSQSSTFSFATAAANVPSTDSGFGFSKPSSFGSSSFSFGNLNVGAATTTANTSFGSAFGQSANSNPFAKPAGQEQKPAFGGGSLFGTPTTTASSSIFGGGATSGFGSSGFGSPTTGFGSPSQFGQQPAFSQNQNTFGGSFGSPTQPGPFSAGSQSVAQTGFGAFGQAQKPSGFGAAPVFGGSPGGFGTSPSFGGGSPGFGAAPAFGSPTAATSSFGTPTQQENPTFANLATQNTLGFGALAQQSQTNPSMSFSSGGGSSFSTWR